MSLFVAHIAYAEVLLHNSLQEKEREDFIVGTTFPDIRFLGTIERDKSHYKNITFKAIKQEKDSFIAGVKFHGLIDIVREKYMEDNVYPLISNTNDKIRALKIAEDIILDDKLDNREEIVQMFKNILSQEKEFPVARSTILEWHQIVSEYLSNRLTPESIIKGLLALYISEEQAQEYAEDGYAIANNKEVRDLVINFYNNLEKELSDYLT